MGQSLLRRVELPDEHGHQESLRDEFVARIFGQADLVPLGGIAGVFHAAVIEVGDVELDDRDR